MTLNDTDIEAAARLLIEHRDLRTPHPVASIRYVPPDLATAYRIQSAFETILVSERGDRAIGYKIGATNQVARAHLKIQAPFFGRLYHSITSASPAHLPNAPGFFRAHEPEIGLQIDRDLPPAQAPYTAEQIAAATRTVLPVIEVVGSCFSPWAEAGAPNLAADNAAHGYWVTGTPITDFAGLDLPSIAVSLSVNGAVVATGEGRNVDGGPFGAAAWLANTLAGMGRGLKAGDFISTGTVLPPYPTDAGQDVTADFGPLGRVALRMGG